MIELKSDMKLEGDPAVYSLPLSFHSSFYPVAEKLKKWLARYPHLSDNSIFSDLSLVYLLATKKYLEHRTPSHLFRLVLSVHFIQKKLLHPATIHPHLRHLAIRWIPTNLCFPFSSKPVLGCLIGFNVLDRYELFDEENVLLALQKYLPELRLVKESSYCHISQYKNLKIFYLELEKKESALFSLSEQTLLKNNLEEKIRKSIQPLSPHIFMGPNDEDVYKNILVLSQEIQRSQDISQVNISLEQQSGKEIVFRITWVYISPPYPIDLKELLSHVTFVHQRTLAVRNLEHSLIEAQIFRIHLARDASLLRSDGSLNFYAARQKIVDLLLSAIGEFRDYNGGMLIKQQELLDQFKEKFPEVLKDDPELMDSFFYAIVPLEKQVVLPLIALSRLFNYFLENRKEKLPRDSIYSFKVYRHQRQTFFVIKGDDSSLTSSILPILQDHTFSSLNIAYNTMETVEGVFINAIFLQEENDCLISLIQSLQESLHKWHQHIEDRQILRVGLENSAVSLDPRIGGETVSGNVLRLLFEGLTRFHPNGSIENGVAESIEVSFDSRQYLFKLRSCLWNDGSPITAYDFEYAWKKILSPDFKTAFAYLFHPIKNAKEAKEGKVSLEEVGIRALDERTLKVDLLCSVPYFLQLTAHPLYSPVHHLIDEQHPQWPYQCETHYPCNGPFQLKFNQPNQGYQLIKNPLYWDAGQIVLDQITLTHMNPTQAFQAFQKKEIDWIGAPFGSWHPLYIPGKEDQLISFSNNDWVCWLVFNTNAFPFHHPKLRQAFSYAIKRAQIASQSAFPLNPAYYPCYPYSRKDTQYLFPEFDGEKARQLFDEALEELGLQKSNFSYINLSCLQAGFPESVAYCLAQQVRESIGIELNIQPLPWKTLFNSMTRGNFQMGLMQWSSWVDDPMYTLNAFKFATQEVNFAKWESAEFKKLVQIGEQETNSTLRSSYLRKAEELLSREMPIIPLCCYSHRALVAKDLHVIEQNLCGTFNVARSYFETEEVNMNAILKQEMISEIEQSITEHPAWLGCVSGLKAEKLLRNKKPYLYVLRTGEYELEYYVTFVLPDLTVKHQPFVITLSPEGWYCENGGIVGPCTDASIDDVLHLVMHCEKGQNVPLVNFERLCI